MLVLGRKENESILIGENIRVTIIGRSGSSIKIGIDAPGNVKVLRGELKTCLPPPAQMPSGPVLSSSPALPGRIATGCDLESAPF